MVTSTGSVTCIRRLSGAEAEGSLSFGTAQLPSRSDGLVQFLTSCKKFPYLYIEWGC